MFRRLLDKINRFMFGRYGADQLFYALIILYVILTLLSRFFGVFMLLAYVAFFYAIYRYFSKNIYKRREENRKFLSIWQKIKNYFSYLKDRWKDRKVCRYRKCKYCGAIVRLPIKKGKHSVRCPKCGKSFKVHILF
ncbi:MAG: hypothetical protein IIX18_04365 [Clostridia bacterium]|nr:hypothetical protein [Clostridia bacterium]MBQ6614534.1 hypothetical protein [Clostridia bacterium]